MLKSFLFKQIHLVSKRVNQKLFLVENGQVALADQGLPDMSSDFIRVANMTIDNKNIENKQLAANGYM